MGGDSIHCAALIQRASTHRTDVNKLSEVEGLHYLSAVARRR